MKTLILIAGLLLAALSMAPTTADAATPATLVAPPGTSGGAVAVPRPPANLLPNEVAGFVAPLSDREARALLLAELQAKAAAASAAAATAAPENEFARLLQQRREAASMFGDRMAAIAEAWRALPDRLVFMHLLLTNLTLMDIGLLRFATAALAAGLASLIVFRLTRRIGRGQLAQATASWPSKFLRLALCLGIDLASVLMFPLVGGAMSSILFDANDPMRLFSEAYGTAIAFALLVWVAARFVFAAHAPHLRLFVMGDRVARRATWLAVLIALTYGIAHSSIGLVELLGGGEELLAILRLGLTAVSIVIGFAFLLTARVDPPAGPLWRAWPWISLGVLVLASAQWAINAILGAENPNVPALLGFVIVLCAPVLNASLLAVFHTPLGANETRRFLATAARRGLVGLWLALALALFAQGAGLPLLALLETPHGQAVLQMLLRVALTTLVAAVIWAVLRDWIDRWIARERDIALANADQTGLGEGESGTAIIGTRAQTLLPLFRATILVLIVAIAFLMTLSTIGVDIGPLLAGAGVIGIAIGFGAQALVRDVVSGIFFLVDDAFRVGEYLEIDNLRGEVEKISVRSMQLRHHRGMVQTIPFGELRHITNYSRDWVIYKQDFLVPFETDIEFVRKMIKTLGQEMLANPDYGHLFLEPLKSQGVTRIEEAGMVIRTKFTCKPRQQFLLRRYVNLNIQRQFLEHGIQFARRRIQVENASGPTGDREAAAAAQSVLEQEAGAGRAGAAAAG